MCLGIVVFGGVLVFDYFIGVVLGIVFVVIFGKGVEYGIGLVVFVFLLML